MDQANRDNELKSLHMEGRAHFERAHFLAFWEEIRDIVRHKPVQLLSFDDVKTQLRLNQQHYLGLQEIELDRIVGSVGRHKDFTRHFLPKKPEMADRWSNVYAHMNSLAGVPPIDVFKVDDVYFVRDGNHRVSIARQMNLKAIEAYVTELETPIDLEPDMTRKEFDAAIGYAHFLEICHLDRTRPWQEAITLKDPLRYNDLLEHIEIVRRLMSHTRGHDVTTPQAAAHWYDTMYKPAIDLIRKYNLLKHFPKETEADIYLWLIDHFHQIWLEYGDRSEATKLSSALVSFLAEHNIPIPKRLLTEDDQPLPVQILQEQDALEKERRQNEQSEKG